MCEALEEIIEHILLMSLRGQCSRKSFSIFL